MRSIIIICVMIVLQAKSGTDCEDRISVIQALEHSLKT